MSTRWVVLQNGRPMSDFDTFAQATELLGEVVAIQADQPPAARCKYEVVEMDESELEDA